MGKSVVRFGLVGIGGYGASYLREILALAEQGEGTIACAVVRNPSKYPKQSEQLRNKGTRIFSNFPEMLEKSANDIDIVAVPTGIDSHAEMTIAGLEKGKDVVCEKPLAGTVQEVDQMIAAKNKAKKFVGIGFQTVCHPQIQKLKSMIGSGEFGIFKSAVSRTLFPRATSYYERNAWAAKLKLNGKWVLDSPFQNAMAHYTQVVQYLVGPSHAESANPKAICAELYKARPIETYDTFCIRMEFESGGILLSLGTHCSSLGGSYKTRLVFEKGSILIEPSKITIDQNGKGKTEWDYTQTSAQAVMFRNIVDCFHSRGVPICTLENSRPHTLSVNGAFESCPAPRVIPAEFTERHYDKTKCANESDFLIGIKGIEESIEQCFAEEKMFSELGLAWALPGRTFDLRNYPGFPVSKVF